MSDDRTTEMLRKLLDERGAEYEAEHIDFSNYFTWGENDCYSYTEYPDGTVLRIWDCTPEQAIAATLGSDREQALEKKVRLQGDYIDKLTKEKDALFAQNCEAATRHAGQMDMMQRKLDAATLGSVERTCEWKPADPISEGEWWNTECGECITWEPYGTPNYCPNCGAKVVSE